MPIHPRLSVNSICSMGQSFADDLALWADLGVTHVGLISPKLEPVGWDEALRLVDEHGLRVSSMSCYKHGIGESLEFTAAVGADVLYIVTGGYGPISWDDAAAQFSAEMVPWVARAAELGVMLAVEPTNPLRNDTSFVFTVRDAVDLARMSGLGVALDFYSSWYERDLDETVRKNVDLIALVQVDDYKLGTFDIPNRCAVGDGDIPVERLLGMVLDAGYEGVFDLEILGPEVESEGYRAPIARSIERASAMLDRLGA